MKMMESFHEVIGLAEARRDEYDAHHPAGLWPTTRKDIADVLRGPLPAEKALRDKLLTLDLATLRKIEAGMCAGRDGEDVLHVHRVISSTDREVTAHVIGSKLPLAEDLIEGCGWPVGRASTSRLRGDA